MDVKPRQCPTCGHVSLTRPARCDHSGPWRVTPQGVVCEDCGELMGPDS